ncbi:MAG: hypothetical protein ACXWE4_05020 [Methylobacter sp.]
MVHTQLNLAIIQNAISNVTCLFSLPEAYLRKLVGDKNSDIYGFSKIVGTAPNFTPNALKIANGYYLNFTGQIANLPQTLNLFGIGTLRDWVSSNHCCKVNRHSRLSEKYSRGLACLMACY